MMGSYKKSFAQGKMTSYVSVWQYLVYLSANLEERPNGQSWAF